MDNSTTKVPGRSPAPTAATWLMMLVSLAGPLSQGVCAAPPRVLPAGTLPNDARLGPLRGERGDFNLVPAQSPRQWADRAAYVRRALLVASGLWPMPTKTPLEPVIHGKVDQGDYTIEKVYFQCLPGFFVTGSLYRPTRGSGRRPGVLSPHGHFPGGRFQDAGPDAVRRQIAAGAERFEDGGRSFMQSRCVQLARMGCVVFHYDMVGYGDSVQLPQELVHRFSDARHKHKDPPAQGFYSAAAEARLQNVSGLHTYQSIRALDFLTSLPDVDPQRIAVTGGSGGGTQTFMLGASDDRPLVCVPVVIVSTTRQGGCTCENICGLRIGTYNLEFTALHAPKPLLLISADDATRTMGQRGFPELQRHYQALGKPDNVAHVALLHFPHNYNAVSRTAMYHFVNKHLGLGLKEPIIESPYHRLSEKDLTVWDQRHPRPPSGPAAERRLLDWLSRDSDMQLAALVPRDAQTLAEYRRVVGTGWRMLIRAHVDAPTSDVERAALVGPTFNNVKTAPQQGYDEKRGLIHYHTVEGDRAELPAIVLSPKAPAQRAVVWLDEAGKAGLFNDDATPRPFVQRLLAAGFAVVGVDLFEQGEFRPDGQSPRRQRWIEGEDGFAGWTYCYNLPLVAKRAHDILATIAVARSSVTGPAGKVNIAQVDLVGLGGVGPWAAAALSQADGAIARAAIDTAGFRFGRVSDVYDAEFMPGAVKYGDVPALLALAAPTPMWLAGENDQTAAAITAAYRAAGHGDRLTLFAGRSADAPNAAAAWLCGK